MQTAPPEKKARLEGRPYDVRIYAPVSSKLDFLKCPDLLGESNLWHPTFCGFRSPLARVRS
jgi:hypothetical protein